MATLAILLLIVIAAALIWIRYAPSDPDRWHVDPADTSDESVRSYRLIGQDAPRYAGETEDVLEAMSAIVLAEPNIHVLDGDAAEGMITFVARSPVLGFPDYLTFKAVAEGALTKLSVASRARFRASERRDVHQRLDRWLGELQLRFGV